LQMDDPFWAATSAGIVCQPSLGASLRKANFRLIGTVLGAVVVVFIMAAFPQSRWGFILTLSVWCGLCGFAATVLQNFASYAASLAGYTAAIIAAGAVGAPNLTFIMAIDRASEICLGFVCAGLVLTLTGRGTARARAATTIAAIARDVGLGIRTTLYAAENAADTSAADSTPLRRGLIGRVTSLSALLDETVGESPDLRVRSLTLQAAIDGLFAAIAGWRMVATHLETVPPAQAAADAASALAALPRARAIVMTAEARPADTRDRCRQAAHAMAARPTTTPQSALVVHGTAASLSGLASALNGVALLVEPSRAEDTARAAAFHHPDPLPALINGLRSFLAILLISVGWIATAWPSGTTAMEFGAIAVLLFSPRGDIAISNAWGFLAGTMATAGLAAIADFALLPLQEGFLRLALVMGIFLVPLAALSAGEWQKSFFVAAATNFTPLLGPANLPSYDTVSFYNTTLAVCVGVGTAMLVLALLPQLPPRWRVQRLLGLTLRDLRRLTRRARPGSPLRWQTLLYGRIGMMPECASPLERSQLVAALYVGEAVLGLRTRTAEFGRESDIEPILTAIGRGDPDGAARALQQADAALAGVRNVPPGPALRARAALLALSEALARHAAFFAMGESRHALH
jgi:uncharacterized membrane protein YccC